MKYCIYRTMVLAVTSLELDGSWANVTTPDFSSPIRVLVSDLYPDEMSATHDAISQSLTRLLVHTARLKELGAGLDSTQ